MGETQPPARSAADPLNVTPTGISRLCPSCRGTYPIGQAHLCEGVLVEAPAPAAGAEPEASLVGAILGERYEIIRFLQGGGMGVVYEARHIVLDKPVAVKILREVRDKVMQQRFLLEATSACRIGHPHIVDITDFGVLDDGRPYLVMEFLQGQALNQLIARGPLSPLRACVIGEQIANGLHAVHEKGIIHRDLKPANIFVLDRDGRDFVKILDFGIAKVVAGGAPGAARLTQHGIVMGTAEYMAPEQSTGREMDHRVDQYALGCILYELLTGEVPHDDDSVPGIMMKHVTAEVVPPRERRPELPIPASLEAVILKAMARRREDRYRDMRALGAALSVEAELLRGSAPAAAPRPAMMRTEAMAPVAPPRRRLLHGAAAGGALGLLLLLLWARVRAPAGPSSPPAERAVAAASASSGAGAAASLAAGSPVTATPRPPRAGRGAAAGAGDDPTAGPAPRRAHRRGEGAERGKVVTVTFENGGEAPLALECTALPPCRLAAGGACQLRLGAEEGRCEARAPGHRERSLSFAELRGRARARISLEKMAAPAGLKMPASFRR